MFLFLLEKKFNHCISSRKISHKIFPDINFSNSILSYLQHVMVFIQISYAGHSLNCILLYFLKKKNPHAFKWMKIHCKKEDSVKYFENSPLFTNSVALYKLLFYVGICEMKLILPYTLWELRKLKHIKYLKSAGHIVITQY